MGFLIHVKRTSVKVWPLQKPDRRTRSEMPDYIVCQLIVTGHFCSAITENRCLLVNLSLSICRRGKKSWQQLQRPNDAVHAKERQYNQAPCLTPAWLPGNNAWWMHHASAPGSGKINERP